MNYLQTYKFFLNTVAIISSISLSVFSTRHYIFLNQHKFIYRFHRVWYTFSSSCTVIILCISILIWFISTFLPLVIDLPMDKIRRSETYIDSLTISICILWITHLLVELSMEYPVEYREILSQSLVLYVLVLSVRLPLFITIDYATSIKSHIKDSVDKKYIKRDNIIIPWSL